MKQQVTGGAMLDILTKSELNEALGHHFDEQTREHLRGIKLFRLPLIVATAQGAAFTLSAPAGSNPPGPDQGYIWRITRIMVSSSVLADTAKYVLYVGSDGTPDQRHLIDAIIGGATPGQNVNVAFRPGNKAEWLFPGEQIYAGITGATTGNSYVMTGIAVEVPAEMVGKIA